MKIAILFPGQGSQKAGMGQEFYNNNETFKETFDGCDKQTRVDLKKACFDGEGLELTSITQPALYAVNIATYKMLEKAGISGDIFAGLSLGEYDALAAAEVLDVCDTTSIVTVRGQLMENAVPEGIASMTAVIGMSAKDIQKAIDDIDDVWISNMNSPAQTIIGGKLAALDIADAKLKQAGASVVKRLQVAGPFHTPLLKEAGNKLFSELEKHEINITTKEIYSNVTGELYAKGADIIKSLAQQVSSKVHWSNIMDEVIDTSDVIIECGPGNVISKLIKRQIKQSGTDRDIKVFKASTLKDIEQIMEYVLA